MVNFILYFIVQHAISYTLFSLIFIIIFFTGLFRLMVEKFYLQGFFLVLCIILFAFSIVSNFSFINNTITNYEIVKNPVNRNKTIYEQNGMYLQKKEIIQEEKKEDIYILQVGKGLSATSYSSISPFIITQNNTFYNVTYEESKGVFRHISFSASYVFKTY